MKRTTIMLPDELATLLDLERRRRDVSAAEIVREALERYLVGGPQPARPLSFIGIGAGDGSSVAGRIDEVLAEEWERDLRRDAGLDRDR